VLVTLGGVTRARLLSVVVRAVHDAVRTAAIDVVVGPTGDAFELVEASVASVPGVRLHRAPQSLRALMVEADLAVSAGGVTVYELAATATPTVAVCLADNQRLNLAGLAAEGALILAGDADDAVLATRLGTAVAQLATDAGARDRLARRARRLVDGRGAGRVATRVLARLRRGAEASRC
jgi:spore coat polysaccharide biosynthesis predicted glycosyltransferase SpsG